MKTVMVSKNYGLLRLYNFFYDFRPYEAIAVLYYAQVTGSYALGLTVFAIASVAGAAFELPTGVLSDRVGRKVTVVLGSLSSIAAISLYAVGGSFLWLAIGAVFNGLTRAFLSGNNDALLYDSLKQQGKSDEFADKLGKANSMFELGLAFSALAAAGLATISLQAVMIASIVPQVICALIAVRFIEPKIHDDKNDSNVYNHLKEALHTFRANAKLRKLSAAYVIDYAIGETYYQFKPAFIATLWPAWALGISRALDNGLGFLGYHFAGRIVGRFGALKTLMWQQVIGRLNVLLAAAFPNPVSPLLLNANSFFYGVGETANGDLLHKEFTDRQRATMGSLNYFIGSLAYALVKVRVGLIADEFGPAKTILVLGIDWISLVFIYLNLFVKHNKF